MRLLFILLTASLLAGCQLPPAAEAPGGRGPATGTVSLEQRLARRDTLCQLSELERRAQLRFLKEQRDESSAMERLLLASCRPDQTPGLLYEALEALPTAAALSPADRTLVALIRDFSRSYRLLEANNQLLKERLEATIEGIQQIESDIDGMSGGNP